MEILFLLIVSFPDLLHGSLAPNSWLSSVVHRYTSLFQQPWQRKLLCWPHFLLMVRFTGDFQQRVFKRVYLASNLYLDSEMRRVAIEYQATIDFSLNYVRKFRKLAQMITWPCHPTQAALERSPLTTMLGEFIWPTKNTQIASGLLIFIILDEKWWMLSFVVFLWTCKSYQM